MSDLPELPEINQTAPAGWQWVWRVDAGCWWRVAPEGESRPCRAGAGSDWRLCGRPSVAVMVRVDDVPWHYCAGCLHRYGRLIVDGVLYEQRLERR